MTTKRKGLSTRLRFEIFKRDKFRCVYCGATPVQAVLRVDHVEPVSKGGSDEPCNLVTSCFDCNGGKSGRWWVLKPRSFWANLVEGTKREGQ